jgi:hypothetical protein
MEAGVMPALMVTCPTTARIVPTGIEIEAEDLRALPRVAAPVYCQACGEKHFWTRDDAMLDRPEWHRESASMSRAA